MYLTRLRACRRKERHGNHHRDRSYLDGSEKDLDCTAESHAEFRSFLDNVSPDEFASGGDEEEEEEEESSP